jgi:hypothetical protein
VSSNAGNVSSDLHTHYAITNAADAESGALISEAA